MRPRRVGRCNRCDIVIDLSEVSYLDSCGLHELSSAQSCSAALIADSSVHRASWSRSVVRALQRDQQFAVNGDGDVGATSQPADQKPRRTSTADVRFTVKRGGALVVQQWTSALTTLPPVDWRGRPSQPQRAVQRRSSQPAIHEEGGVDLDTRRPDDPRHDGAAHFRWVPGKKRWTSRFSPMSTTLERRSTRPSAKQPMVVPRTSSCTASMRRPDRGEQIGGLGEKSRMLRRDRQPPSPWAGPDDDQAMLARSGVIVMYSTVVISSGSSGQLPAETGERSPASSTPSRTPSTCCQPTHDHRGAQPNPARSPTTMSTRPSGSLNTLNQSPLNRSPRRP